MDFNLTRTSSATTTSKESPESAVDTIIKNIFHPSIESVSVTKSLIKTLENDGSTPPKHVQIDSKYVKTALKHSIIKLKTKLIDSENLYYSELLILNIFMSDYALAWELRKSCQNLSFEKELMLVRTASLVAPKSAELWLYYRFLVKKFEKNGKIVKTGKIGKALHLQTSIIDWTHYQTIAGLHFSNYYLHSSEVLENSCGGVSFEQHVELVKTRVSDGSVVLNFCKKWCNSIEFERCVEIIEDLILVYSQGLESLWRGRQILLENKSGGENCGRHINSFLSKVLNKSSDEDQLRLASRFIVVFQNS